MPDLSEPSAAGADKSESWTSLASPEGAATGWTSADLEPVRPAGQWEPADQDQLTPPGASQSRRRRLRIRLVAVATTAALLGAGVIALLQPGGPATGSPNPGASATAAPGSSPGPAQAADASTAAKLAVAGLLEARAAAVLARDKSGYLATIDPRATDFRDSQADVFDSLAALPLESWEYSITITDPFELSSKRRKALDSTAWTVEVALRYEIKEFDNAKSRLRLYYTVVQRGGRWYIASDGDGAKAGKPSQVGLWDLGKLNVVEGERSLVLGLGGTSELRQFAREADQAVPRVTKVWGTDWAAKVLVVVPDTQAQMERLSGVDPGHYDQIAAVTRRESGQDADESASDRVIINPALWSDLGTQGRRVVMTHEITHVATHDSNSGAMPTWLSEGFADYVAYETVPVSVELAAQELFAAVRRGKLPDSLPTSRDFSPTNARLAQAYEGAWLACKLLADRHGQDKLVAFYRAVGTAGFADAPEDSLDKAFTDGFGLTTATFTGQWRAYLENQAG